MPDTHDVLMVGCGHLGQALLRRWLEADSSLYFTVIKPSPLPDDLAKSNRIVRHAALPTGLAQHHTIIYAIRPQAMTEILPHYRALAQHATNISVAAGWSTQKLAQHLGDCALIRTMPNVPAQIGQGMTPMFANAICKPSERQIAEDLFRAVGEFIWLNDESHMDIATAVSGSGPAYLYLLTAAITQAGITLGLPAATAATLARTTVCGAAQYMVQTGQAADALYQAMQLPGGTTEAALQRLLRPDGMAALMREAITLAAKRAQEIGAA